MITIIALTMIWCGVSLCKHIISARRIERQALMQAEVLKKQQQVLQELSAQETKRLSMLADYIQHAQCLAFYKDKISEVINDYFNSNNWPMP